MSSSTVPLPGLGIVKPNLGQFTNHYAMKVAPPERRKDMSGKSTLLVKAVEENGNEMKLPCSESVYKRVLGVRRVHAAHTGLDHQIHHHFVLKRNPESMLVEAIHSYPKVAVLHNLHRVEVPAHGHLVVSVDPATGDMNVEDVPERVTAGHMKAALQALDEVGLIQGEQSLGNGMFVKSVQGGVIYINVDNMSMPDPTVMSEDEIFA